MESILQYTISLLRKGLNFTATMENNYVLTASKYVHFKVLSRVQKFPA